MRYLDWSQCPAVESVPERLSGAWVFAGTLRAAEQAQFGVFITADKNIRYQQNLAERKIAIIVLSTPQWPRVKKHIDKIVVAVDKATAGAYIDVDIPFEDER